LHAIEEFSAPLKPYRKTNEKRLKQKKKRKLGELPHMHLVKKWRLSQMIRAD
jgi:hypothetical protein